jgi:hypothetical protein
MQNSEANQLARMLQDRMKQIADTPSAHYYGVIQSDMSLLLNNFPVPIPQSDYMVCRSVAWGKVDDIFYKTQTPGKDNSGKHKHGPNGAHSQPDAGYGGSHDHPEGGREMEHIHDTLIGDKFRWLMPGDRVLVALVGENEFCVIDLVLPAMSIGRDADGYKKIGGTK